MNKYIIGTLLSVVTLLAVVSVWSIQSTIIVTDMGAAAGTLPNKSLTPGAANSQVTQANIQSTICKSGWTATIRPPASYTTALKIKQVAQYGYKDTKTGDYELDHLVSLELGGAPSDPLNLWPQKYVEPLGAHDKDRIENELHQEVCSGIMTLHAAQQCISTDWTNCGTKGTSFGAISGSSDEDDSN